MTTKSLGLSLSLALALASLAAVGARAADIDVTPHARVPHVTYGPAIPQYVPVQRYVAQQGLPDEGPMTLLDSPYSSAAYPVEYAGPGYDYAPVYGPFYGTGIPFARRHGFDHGVGVWHGGYRQGGWRGAWRGAAHRHPATMTAARHMAPRMAAPRMMAHPSHHR